MMPAREFSQCTSQVTPRRPPPVVEATCDYNVSPTSAIVVFSERITYKTIIRNPALFLGQMDVGGGGLLHLDRYGNG